MRLIAAALILIMVGVPPVQADHVSIGSINWACGGFNGSGQRGHPDGCGIDPIGGDNVQSEGEPQWGAAWTDDLVLGIVVNGDARAVPVVMLDLHEIVNDRIGDRDIAITYCPLCGSGVAFDRQVTIAGQTRTLDFAASGFLYQNDLVMWDPQTGTLWNQITGTAIASLVDGRVERGHEQTELDVVPLVVTTWDEWQAQHPGATMLQKVRSHYSNPYGSYASSGERCGLGSCLGVDESLHPKELVIGVEHRGPKAYPIFGVQADGGVVQDAGIVVAVTPGGAHAVHDAGGRVFQHNGTAWLDGNGTAWDLSTGTSQDGQRLEAIDALRMFWFAWSEHHPDTALWSPQNETASPLREDNGKLPGFTIPIVAGILLVLAILWRRR